MTISKQVLAQWLAHTLGLLVGYVCARQGVHLSATASGEVAACASLIAGPLAGALVNAEPVAAHVVTGEVERLLAVMAESPSNGRSALSANGRPSTAAVATSPETTAAEP